MSKPLLDDTVPDPAAGKRKLMLVLAIAVPLVGVALAVPFLGGDDDGEDAAEKASAPGPRVVEPTVRPVDANAGADVLAELREEELPVDGGDPFDGPGDMGRPEVDLGDSLELEPLDGPSLIDDPEDGTSTDADPDWIDSAPADSSDWLDGVPADTAEQEPEAVAPTPDPVPVEDPAETAEPEEAPRVVSEDGDLAVTLRLRWERVRQGQEIPATVRIENFTLQGFHLPADGESFPTLAVVVLDAEGNEVHRIVQAGDDPLPRRTVLLQSGELVERSVAVLEAGEDTLPPGEYSAHVEFSTDRAWKRLGLPVWTAPNGRLKSSPVRFTVDE